MKAAFIERYGKNEKLIVGEMPEPVVGDTDVLVAVRAASVNPVDFRVRNGALRMVRKYRFPLILGHDLAGVVVRAGRHVTRFQPGDEVFARPSSHVIGTFAELIAVEQTEVALKPKNLSFTEAASLPLVGLTSWQALVDIAKVKPGQKVFIHAGSGGVGSFAIQLAKHLGAFVTATTSTKNLGAVKALGADLAIDYTQQDFTKVAEPQDVIFATIGGKALYQSFDIIAPGGIVISLTDAPEPSAFQELGWFKKMLIRALSHRARALAGKRHASYRFMFMKASGEQLGSIASLVERGAIRPTVEKVYAFSEVQKAMEHAESGRVRGKIVVAHS
jgi:alcohol dehydrogenase